LLTLSRILLVNNCSICTSRDKPAYDTIDGFQWVQLKKSFDLKFQLEIMDRMAYYQSTFEGNRLLCIPVLLLAKGV